jgi:hypothetical protein
MSRCYSNSKFFIWFRSLLGINKPAALPFGQWEVWEQDLKSARPVAFWLTETLPDLLEKPRDWIVDPINDLAYYLRMRFVYRSHYVHTNLEPGRHHEFDEKILRGAFTELTNFVEVECAWMFCIWNDENARRYRVPWWRHYGLLRWSLWRSPGAGIAQLKWQIDLDSADKDPQERNPGQADYAREVLLLYTWWTQVRRDRDEDFAWIESGYREFSKEITEKYGSDWEFENRVNLTQKEKDRKRKLYDCISELENNAEQEDNDMLMRLIKIRKSLWT